MYQPLPNITEDLATLQERLRSERDPQLKPRLHLLVLLNLTTSLTYKQLNMKEIRHFLGQVL